MLSVTRDLMLPTAITGSYPRPLWFNESLRGRSFKSALGDSLFREQYLDAVAAVINAQEAAGLDIVTDGDTRFDLAVGGKSWFFYPIERLGGIEGHRDTSRGWMQRHGLRPGKILWEVQEAYQPAVVKHRLTRGPLEYSALWKTAQRLTDKPVKFGAICAPALASMLWDEHYKDDKKLINELSDIMNAEFRELSAAGCPSFRSRSPRTTGARRGPIAPTPTSSSSRRRSTASSWASTRRSGYTRAGAIRTSSACTGRCRATSARCRTCSSSTAT